MLLKILLIYLTLTTTLAKINLNPLEEDTLYPINGRVCAYGDMNKDQYTDIIVYDNNSLFIMFQPKSGNLKFNEDSFYQRIKLGLDSGQVYCAVADFNGDAYPDIMVTTDTSDGSNFKTTVYIQQVSKSGATFLKQDIDVEFKEQPSVMDVNGDGMGDVVGFDRNNMFVCLKGSGRSETHFENCTDMFTNMEEKKEPYPHFSPIFTDVDGDLSAEIIFGINDKSNGKLRLEVYKLSRFDHYDSLKWEYNVDLTNRMSLPIDKEINLSNLGNPVVADFDADGAIEILLPEYEIYHDTNKGDFMFRVGDFSLDGFPDLIVTVSSENRVLPMILENVEYPDNVNFSRKFELKSSSRLFVMPAEMSQSVKMAAFFDLKEDGNLDILVEYSYEGKLKFDFIKCDDKGDTTFLKVQIFTDICDFCKKADGEDFDKGSGITWHGACSSYSTTDYLGQTRLSSQCQIPQTSHRALYSPYVLFGLGRSPNFVDEVKFGAPQQVDGTGYQHHHIPQVVPNSRIIAIPPKNTNGVITGAWQIRLYLTPSSLIIQSLFVLMIVCAILSLVVVILHMREKHADKKERQAQSHRFHFDAM